ncbi:hypothetical protein Syun_005027 [Stephania yunnanensis]|uniref:DUF4371 domain-containing protein n=1 Tax=Stephania yunnanensis TaxID=152371 RepID=A0AAP0Q1Y3_9MAGN
MGRLNVNIEDVILDNAPGNTKYTSPNIQKEILHIMANMVRKKIREEIGDKKFCLLVDEAKDAGGKEEMAIVLRFVDGQGSIKERFFDIVQVENTAASTLKKSVCNSLARYNLLIDDLRGQGYDGASNMRGAWNGLQALFLKDCPYAYYVYCFAHRLQLALVAASKKEPSIWLLFSKLSSIVNLIGSSPKCLTELQAFQAVEIARKVASGERETGKGANQIGSLQRAGETRWSSHFDSIYSVIDMYWATMQVLKKMVSDGSTDDIRGESKGVLMMMETFDFVFMLHVMHRILGITNMFCRNLQEKTLDILNAIDSIATTKVLLLKLRNESFDHLLMCVNSICIEYEIETPDMNAWYNEGTGRSCQQKSLITVEHHYHFDMFNSVIDYQLEELNCRFNDDALEILKLSCALQPNDQFKLFDVDQICILARKFYPADFSDQEMHHLRFQLEHYEVDVLHHKCFQNLSSTSELLQKLIRTNKSHHYNLVERLIKSYFDSTCIYGINRASIFSYEAY